jgi:glycosyltransferase involved in cell wall biosynthesis
MPKVLRIINRFNLGGPTFNAAYLTKYLAPEYETLLIGGLKEEHEESSEFIVKELGVNFKILPEMRRSINFFNDLKAYNAIKKIIKDFKPDIVHTHAAKAGALGRRAAYYLDVPVIIHTFHGHVFHSYFNKYKTEVFKAIERDLAKKSTRIIAISEIQKYELTSIHNICPPEKVEVIPLGFDLTKFHLDNEIKRSKFREEYKLRDDEIAIGIIGRLAPVKNHKLFINALKYLKDNSSGRFKAFIIGDGDELNNIKSHAKDLGLDSEITFTSWIKQIDYAIAGMDIIAMTSLNEGTPVSLIEAQAANKPIVSTNVGGIENVVIPNKTALLSDVNDEKTFSENLLMLVENETLRKELSISGWEHVESKFHYTRLVSDTKKIYDQLLDTKHKYQESRD